MSPTVSFKSNAEIAEEEKTAAEAMDAARQEYEQPGYLTSLAAYLDLKWEKALRGKHKAEERMLQNLRARNGEYEPNRLAAIKAMYPPGYEPIFMKITETKCRAAEAWVRDILRQPGQEPWDIKPTPMPELPPAIQQKIEEGAQNMVIQQAVGMLGASGVMPGPEQINMLYQQMLPYIEQLVKQMVKERAVKAAERMKEKIHDQFVEGGWDDALDECIYDIVTFGTAIMKGPCLRMRPVRIREFDQFSGAWSTRIEDRIVPVWERINPLNFYPAPEATSSSLPWSFEKISFSRRELSNLLDVPRYDANAIREVLREHRAGGLRLPTPIDQTKAGLEERDSVSIWETESIEGLKYDGSAPGSLLLEWGLTPAEVPDPDREYEAEIYKIDRWVIKAILNPKRVGKVNIFSAGFSEQPDSFWHRGVPELIEHIQHLANACARSIVQNVGLASGPMVEVNEDRLAAGEKFSMYPMKITYSTSKGMMESPAVKFYQPEIVTHRLMEVYRFCLEAADDDSGIPRYAHTGESQQAASSATSSGLNMLMSHSAKGIKNVVKNIDVGIIETSVEGAFHYNMEYEEQDQEIIGDLKVMAKGSSALVQKEQSTIRRTELLERTNNPVDLQIMGLPGRAELLRKNLEGLDIDVDKVIAEEEQIQAMAQGMAPGAAAPAGPGGPPAKAQRETGPDGQPVAGRDNQQFESQEGVRP